MADISVKRAHSLGLKGAHAAATKMANKLSEKFDLQGSWSGNTMNFSRPGVTGILAVSESELKLDVTLGFMLKMMKGPIEKSVHEQLDKVLKDAAATPAPKTVAKTAVKPAKTVVAAKATPKPTTKKNSLSDAQSRRRQSNHQ